MLISQVILVFNTIRKHDGLTIEQLAEKVEELYGERESARYMIYGDEEYWLLRARIRELDCVEVRDGKYHYNPDAKPYTRDQIINACILEQLAHEKDEMMRRAKK